MADAIFRNATDGKTRLRYTANGAGAFLSLNRWLRSRLARADEKCIPQNRAVALNRSGCPVRQRRSGRETSFRPGRFMGKVNIETLSQSALFRPQSGHRLPWPIGG